MRYTKHSLKYLPSTAQTVLVLLLSASTNAYALAPSWRTQSRMACIQFGKGELSKSFRGYQSAIALAKRSSENPDLILDLELDACTVLIRMHRFTDAEERLAALRKSCIDDRARSLISLRYCRRVCALHMEQKNFKACIFPQERVIDSTSANFSCNSKVYSNELGQLVLLYFWQGDWQNAIAAGEQFKETLDLSPKRKANDTYLKTLFANKHLLLEKIVAGALSDSLCSRLARLSASDGAELSFLRYLFDHQRLPAAEKPRMVALSELSGSDNDKGLAAAIQLGYMFDCLQKKDGAASSESEQAARKAVELEKFALRQKSIDIWNYRIQARSMYSMILARRGKLREAEEQLDSLAGPQLKTFTVYTISGILQAREALVQEYAAKKMFVEAKRSYESFRQLIAPYQMTDPKGYRDCQLMCNRLETLLQR